MPRATHDNERVASRLSEQRLARVRYFLLRLNEDGGLWDWDFGVWHSPTMGVELATEQGETFSAIWSEYYDWGFGVDLFNDPMSAHVIPEAADNRVDVSTHKAWASFLDAPINVDFLWNDYGTGRRPCPDAVKVSTGPDTAAWIITADWERHGGKTSIQLGADALMVVFDDKFVDTLGLFDQQHGRVS